MKIHIVNNHTKHIKELESLLADHELTVSDALHTDYMNIAADVVIFSGWYQHPFYSDHFQSERSFIQSTEIPIIGICLGCQILVDTYGGLIHREESKITWVHQLKYVPSQSHYRVYESHIMCIKDLPEDLVGVAVSEYGYEIVKHPYKNQRGLQFHPEVRDPDNDGALLFTTILSEIV